VRNFSSFPEEIKGPPGGEGGPKGKGIVNSVH
jgi:hypothetical protein